MPVLTKNLLTLENSDATHANWSAERSGLLADALQISGRLRLRVHGESMLPSLWPGDVVEIEGCSPRDLRCGDIVLALRDGRHFLHRLILSNTPDGFLLRGDSMPGPDPLFNPEAVLGRLARSRGQRQSQLVRAMSRGLGILFCHCGIARRLALQLHHRWKTPAQEFSSMESA
jgi:hypothetical protein